MLLWNCFYLWVGLALTETCEESEKGGGGEKALSYVQLVLKELLPRSEVPASPDPSY